MTGDTRQQDGDEAETRLAGRAMVWAVIRVVLAVVVLGTLYYRLPLDHVSAPVAVAILVVGLAALVTLVVYQVRWIVRSPLPGFRAVEALGTDVPFFLLLFSSTYVVMAALTQNSFGTHLSHTDGLYFSVTVFSTVGFGDITPKSEPARLVVTGQMFADVLILGLAIKVIVSAWRRGRAEKSQTAGR